VGSVLAGEKAETEGGGAWPMEAGYKMDKMEANFLPVDDAAEIEPGESRWHALWTRSHCEQMVHDQLAGKKFELFLPKINVWSRRGGLRCLSQVPLFPGYLFLYHAVDKRSYHEVLKTRGLVRVLGERWDRLAIVPEKEIESIKKVLDSQMHVMAHPFLREGQRVRISRGPLKDVEGILLKMKPEKGLFVVSVELLKRSVAVEVDCTLVAAA
jgi:transcription antitermination factor NusG